MSNAWHEIEVSVNDYDDDDGHVEINVTSLAFTNEFSDGHAAGLFDARHHAAGILGRLAYEVAQRVAVERVDHGCRGYTTPGAGGDMAGPRAHRIDECALAGSGQLSNPGADVTDCVELWIYVPRARQKVWIGWIRQWLIEIAASTPPRSVSPGTYMFERMAREILSWTSAERRAVAGELYVMRPSNPQLASILRFLGIEVAGLGRLNSPDDEAASPAAVDAE